MNDITKLPQWAQRHIERLQRNMAQMEVDVAMIVGATPSAIEIDPNRVFLGKDKPRLFLPERYSVRFNVTGGRVDVSMKGGQLDICGHSDAGEFVIMPKSSNVIHAGFAIEAIYRGKIDV